MSNNPRSKPRPRTRLERILEPFLTGIIGAEYGGIYYFLAGKSLGTCLLTGALLFALVDFLYLRYFDTDTAER